MLLKAQQRVFGLLLMGGLLILAGCGQVEFAASTPNSTPVPTPSETSQPNDKETYTAMLQATEVAVIATAWAEQTVIALTPTVPSSPVVIIPSTPEELPLGIIAATQPSLPAAYEYRPENGWRGKVDGTYLLVYAGAYRGAPEHGFLSVQTMSGDTMELINGAFYDTPTMAGSVHIIAADGLRLTLLATSEVQFVFDVGTRQWLTATPGPSPSPGLSPLPTAAP